MTQTFADQPWLTMLTFAPLIGALAIIMQTDYGAERR